MSDERCPVCGSEDIVKTGPLTIEGQSLAITVVSGEQCTLCGHLAVMVPQAVLVRLYPPGVRYLTAARRERLMRRRRARTPLGG